MKLAHRPSFLLVFLSLAACKTGDPSEASLESLVSSRHQFDCKYTYSSYPESTFGLDIKKGRDGQTISLYSDERLPYLRLAKDVGAPNGKGYDYFLNRDASQGDVAEFYTGVTTKNTYGSEVMDDRLLVPKAMLADTVAAGNEFQLQVKEISRRAPPVNADGYVPDAVEHMIDDMRVTCTKGR